MVVEAVVPLCALARESNLIHVTTVYSLVVIYYVLAIHFPWLTSSDIVLHYDLHEQAFYIEPNCHIFL